MFNKFCSKLSFSPFLQYQNFPTMYQPQNFFSLQFADNIFALSSGQGKCGVSVIRVSGKEAFNCFHFLDNENAINVNQVIEDPSKHKNKKISNMETNKVYHKKLYSLFDNPRTIIDEGIFFYFKEPKSFTGENTVEFHIHGSKAIQSKLIDELGKIPNFRLAEPGEFTKRGFFNGKFDLMKIEGLADLINSETEQQRVQSMHHYQGNASKILEQWRHSIIQCMAHAEAYIDFEEHEEDVKSDVYDKVSHKIENLAFDISRHLNDKNRGEILRDGYQISILGPPNAGKSSLLNSLARRKVAIVSDIPGTTRDIITVQLNLGGYQVVLSDTAGLRETTDIIESQGVELAKEQTESSQLCLFLIDAQDCEYNNKNNQFKIRDTEKFSFLDEYINSPKTILMLNKCDLLEDIKLNEQEKQFSIEFKGKEKEVFDVISCQDEESLGNMIKNLSNRIKLDLQNDEHSVEDFSIITKSRHRIELQNCLHHLEEFLRLKDHIEISCEELRSATKCIGRLTGRIDVEEILDTLFRDFCIGK